MTFITKLPYCCIDLGLCVGSSAEQVRVVVMYHAVMFVCRWERRADPRGRTYYVDHNTRTTTWQRPNVDMMNNIQQFQQMRQNRTIDNVARRSLYPTQVVASDDPLGPLPEGWGE